MNTFVHLYLCKESHNSQAPWNYGKYWICCKINILQLNPNSCYAHWVIHTGKPVSTDQQNCWILWPQPQSKIHRGRELWRHWAKLACERRWTWDTRGRSTGWAPAALVGSSSRTLPGWQSRSAGKRFIFRKLWRKYQTSNSKNIEKFLCLPSFVCPC